MVGAMLEMDDPSSDSIEARLRERNLESVAESRLVGRPRSFRILRLAFLMLHLKRLDSNVLLGEDKIRWL